MVNKIVNNGQGTQPKTERNDALVADYRAKMPIPDMVAKYRVSPTVIYNVLGRYGITSNRKAKSKKVKK